MSPRCLLVSPGIIGACSFPPGGQFSKYADAARYALHLPGLHRINLIPNVHFLTFFSRCMASVIAINYIPPTISIELGATDRRTYAQHSLPGRVGGLPTMYHHSHIVIFLNLNSQSRKRLLDPGRSVQDKTNYYIEWKCLCPGVRLESTTGVRGRIIGL